MIHLQYVHRVVDLAFVCAIVAVINQDLTVIRPHQCHHDHSSHLNLISCMCGYNSQPMIVGMDWRWLLIIR
jgi:hypothetical protein